MEQDLDWRNGSAAAFEVLVRRWQQPVARFLFHVVGRQELVADLCQEVFLRVYEHRSRYQETGAFSSWLYRIALNVAHDANRRRRKEPVGLGDREPFAADEGPAANTVWHQEICQTLEGVYWKGQGVVSTATLSSLQPAAKVEPARPPVREWESVRRELRNEKTVVSRQAWSASDGSAEPVAGAPGLCVSVCHETAAPLPIRLRTRYLSYRPHRCERTDDLWLRRSRFKPPFCWATASTFRRPNSPKDAVTVLVLVDEPPVPKRRLSAILANYPGGQLFRSAEEVDNSVCARSARHGTTKS